MEGKCDRVRRDVVENPPFDKVLWALPVASVVITLLTCGITRGNSLLFVAIMEEEHHGRLASSIPFSVIALSSIASAPFIGFLGPRLSFRAITSLGLFIFTLGLLGCSISTNIVTVTFFMFLRGCGNMFVQTLLPQVINAKFTEHRNTAMGISTMGIPLGGFFWPFLIDYFLKTFGWRGTFLLCAGVGLHAFIAVFLISCLLFSKKTTGERLSFYTQSKFAQDRKRTSSESDTDNEYEKIAAGKTAQLQEIASFKCDKDDEKGNGASLKDINENNNNKRRSNEQYVEIQLTQGVLQQKETEVTKTGKIADISNKKILRRVVSSRGFFLITFNTAVTNYVQNSFTQCIVDFMYDEGFETDPALLTITTYSLGGLIGGLCLGWITDRKLLSSQVYNSVMMTITATSLLLATFVPSYYLKLSLYFIVGVAQAGAKTSNWSQFADYFNKEELFMAMSSSKFFQGIIQLIRGPILGLFRDYLFSYKYFFGFLGVLLYTMSLLWLNEFYILRRKSKDYIKVNTEDPDEH